MTNKSIKILVLQPILAEVAKENWQVARGLAADMKLINRKPSDYAKDPDLLVIPNGLSEKQACEMIEKNPEVKKAFDQRALHFNRMTMLIGPYSSEFQDAVGSLNLESKPKSFLTSPYNSLGMPKSAR